MIIKDIGASPRQRVSVWMIKPFTEQRGRLSQLLRPFTASVGRLVQVVAHAGSAVDPN